MSSTDLVMGAAGTGGGDATYVDDVFSTYLYTGTKASQTITNGIDLAGEGGLTWIKRRDTTSNHLLFDTARGMTSGSSPFLVSNTTAAETAISDYVISTSTGFNLGSNATGSYINGSGGTYASWTFRKAPKFFDVVTYTGNGTSGRTVAHNLGSVPGMIIVKRTDTTGDWAVYHRSLGNTQYISLNTTAAATNVLLWNNTTPTSDVFSVGSNGLVNGNGATYVAYLFAHNAGGFGESGTDNVISCGSYVGNGSADGPVIDLGYEPQYILIKNATSTSDWNVIDNMRGITTGGLDYFLAANSTAIENSNTIVSLQATGFSITATISAVNSSGNTYIYMAIRRPMAVPTTGTEVFAPVTYTGTNVDNRLVNTGIVTDMILARIRTATSTFGFVAGDRLRGNGCLGTAITDAEVSDDSLMTPTVGYGNSFSAMNGFGVGNDITRQLNQSSTAQLAYAFQRRPGFFDVVCWTGDGSYGMRNHNLGVVPELIFSKRRIGATNGTGRVWAFNNTYGSLENTNAFGSFPRTHTATQWESLLDNSGDQYVTYLFASCPNVSKVGSYTGTGAAQTINCGFTAGARFVLIKRTDSTGDWYVWDTARGIISGNDPYLLMNSTAAEVTSTDYIDPVSSGFEISSTAPAAINASGGSFIFLAIA